jgi:hypothetical protein
MVMMVLWGHISPQLLQKVMSLYLADLGLHDAGCLDANGIRKLAQPTVCLSPGEAQVIIVFSFRPLGFWDMLVMSGNLEL